MSHLVFTDPAQIMELYASKPMRPCVLYVYNLDLLLDEHILKKTGEDILIQNVSEALLQK